MNALQRVMATMTGQPVDRPPVMSVLSAYGGTLTGTPLTTLFRSPDAFIAGQVAVVEALAFDAVVGTFDFSKIAQAFGSQVAFFDHQAPNMRRPAASSIREALALPVPHANRSEHLEMALACVRGLSDRYRGEVPVIGVLPGPLALPVLLLGMENWMNAVLFERDGADALLERTAEFWVAWATSLSAAGADFLVVPEGMSPREVSTRELFQSLLPHVRNCFSRVSAPLVFHHTGGRINHVLDLVRDLPNLAGATIGSKDDVAEARRLLGPGITILGNLDNLSLTAATPEELRAQALRHFELGETQGPLLLCNSGADVPIKTPVENLRSIRAAADEYATRAPKAVPTATRSRPRCVGCSVLEAEMNELQRRGHISADFQFFDSRLHMRPLALQQVVDKATESADGPTLLLYGDCCPSMLQFSERRNITRVPRVNCAQMVLGKARYRQLMREGAFILLPEWATQWREILENEFGMSSPVAREFMQEQCKKLIYVDTGVMPVPTKALDACAEYLGLPWEIEATGLDELKDVLSQTIGQMAKRESTPG